MPPIRTEVMCDYLECWLARAYVYVSASMNRGVNPATDLAAMAASIRLARRHGQSSHDIKRTQQDGDKSAESP